MTRHPHSIPCWLAWLWLGLTACPGEAQDLPDIKVSFTEESTSFAFPLTEVETLATQRVVDRLGRKFPFLRWTADGDGRTDSGPGWIIQLRREIAGPGSRIWLEHHAQINGNRFELDQIPGHELLYDIGSVLPLQSPSRLRDRVESRLTEQLNDDFLDQVAEHFLRLIPLGQKVLAEADVDPPRLVVPLRLADLKAKPRSLIGVRLKSNNIQFGHFVVKASSQVIDGEMIGFVQGRIQEFEVPPIDDLTPPVWWHPKLPDVIARSQIQEVYMHEYILDLAAGAATDDGIVTDLD